LGWERATPRKFLFHYYSWAMDKITLTDTQQVAHQLTLQDDSTTINAP
jgi:hypothetical protein